MTSSEGATVTAAVLTWNGAHLIELALDSLARQGFQEFRTVVVDNGSADGTVELVRRRWPWAEIIALPDNLGITAGLNRCVSAARGSEFVALLNNDVRLDPAWLGELVAALRSQPRAASASGKILSHSRPELLDRAGDSMSWSGQAIGRGHGQLDRGQYDRPEEVFSACAGAGLFRLAAFDEVGGFDDQFEAYHEDTDWGFRARLGGWTSIYTPSAVAWHVGGATAGHDSPFSLYHGMRNAVWLIVKNYPGRSLVRHAPELLWRHALLVFHTVFGGRGRLLLRAWRDALAGMASILRKRRRVQSLATAKPSDLDRVLSSGWRAPR